MSSKAERKEWVKDRMESILRGEAEFNLFTWKELVDMTRELSDELEAKET